MNREELDLVAETSARIFADHMTGDVATRAEAGQFPRELWQTLEATGLTGTSADALESWPAPLVAVGEGARVGAPVPLAETLIASLLLRSAGQEVDGGVLTAATATINGNELSATAVAFADWADEIVLATGDALYRLPASACMLDPFPRLSGEPAADVSAPLSATRRVEWSGADVLVDQYGALVRSIQLSAAMEACLELSVQYAMERQQFGRAIAKFQAIQHNLAVMAGEVAAARKSADDVLYESIPVNAERIAVAKARCGEAAGVVAEIAHQVHGAMGFTREHPLNLRTRRLWQWRDDFGTEGEWQARLGRRFAQAGADRVWSEITRLGRRD
jgi:acyl-CoA dehydrogenase